MKIERPQNKTYPKNKIDPQNNYTLKINRPQKQMGPGQKIFEKTIDK